MSMTDIDQLLPLTPAVFYILLSLANGEKHGYEIMKQVREDTRGKVKMGNGTMYGSIKRLLTDKLIEAAGDKVDPDNERRKYYKLTGLGRKALHAEMQRYVETVSILKARNLIPNVSKKSSI
jgi:DNA-binding PadR family transcriptional regulator